MKHEVICKDFQHGWLKNVNIKSKTKSLQCSWVKRLYDASFYKWKILPLTLIKNTFENCFSFHSNLDFTVSLNSFTQFCINIFHSWKNALAFFSLTATCLRFQFLWFNKVIKTNNKSFHFRDLSKKNINFVKHLFKPSKVKWL